MEKEIERKDPKPQARPNPLLSPRLRSPARSPVPFFLSRSAPRPVGRAAQHMPLTHARPASSLLSPRARPLWLTAGPRRHRPARARAQRIARSPPLTGRPRVSAPPSPRRTTAAPDPRREFRRLSNPGHARPGHPAALQIRDRASPPPIRSRHRNPSPPRILLRRTAAPLRRRGVAAPPHLSSVQGAHRLRLDPWIILELLGPGPSHAAPGISPRTHRR